MTTTKAIGHLAVNMTFPFRRGATVGWNFSIPRLFNGFWITSRSREVQNDEDGSSCRTRSGIHFERLVLMQETRRRMRYSFATLTRKLIMNDVLRSPLQ